MGRLTQERLAEVKPRALALIRQGGRSYNDIARELGLAGSTVAAWSRGVTYRRPSPGLPEEKVAQIQALARQGHGVTAIARAVGVRRHTVEKYAKDILRGIREDRMMSSQRNVIIKFVGADGAPAVRVVQPTGRFEFCASATHPERQWQMEALDLTENHVRFFPVCDIVQWILPDPAGLRQAGLAAKKDALAAA